MKIYSAYDRKEDKGFSCGDETVTVQYFKDQCDVNNILKQYEKTGLINHVNQFEGKYGDLCEYQDYQTSMNHVIEAQDAFNSLPAKSSFKIC